MSDIIEPRRHRAKSGVAWGRGTFGPLAGNGRNRGTRDVIDDTGHSTVSLGVLPCTRTVITYLMSMK